MQETLTVPVGDVLGLVERILGRYSGEDCYAYEREGWWYIGIGARAQLSIDPTGTKAAVHSNGERRFQELNGRMAAVARDFVDRHLPKCHRMFGQVGFNYAAHSRGQTFQPGRWPLLVLMVPKNEIVMCNGVMVVRASDEDAAKELRAMALGTDLDAKADPTTLPVNLSADEADYEARVAQALAEIAEGAYAKIIISRAIELDGAINLASTLCHGRRFNSPARSFLFKHGCFEAVGFSPELVMAVKGSQVFTEPLAGTRRLAEQGDDNARLRHDLQSDAKEIVEHVLSVKAAVEDVSELCTAESVVIGDFMSIRERGRVQHLGSRVQGTLAEGKDAWDAFDILFPAITASGIPKQAALSAIGRLEASPRELYAGAVLFLEEESRLEAALVLRSVFQDPVRRWIQAGAGVIAQSMPDRELTETKEKLGSFTPFLVASHR
ncbi:salicylate synthase [Mesorhizobium xinjiangense]|uniref:salicylate synthase n=1 Tax=Mesorhizobium xinjiangense TaxID=2678685 RepID=UPI0018DC6448|nr:salicylate synthase [Mesorhizobium xinjiangense]